jgi:hypothetical protein
MHIHLTARIKLETIEQKLEKIKEDREIDCESQLSLKLKYLSRIFQEVYSLSGEDFFYRASTKYAVLGRCAPEVFFWPAIIGEKSSRKGSTSLARYGRVRVVRENPALLDRLTTSQRRTSVCRSRPGVPYIPLGRFDNSCFCTTANINDLHLSRDLTFVLLFSNQPWQLDPIYFSFTRKNRDARSKVNGSLLPSQT